MKTVLLLGFSEAEYRGFFFIDIPTNILHGIYINVTVSPCVPSLETNNLAQHFVCTNFPEEEVIAQHALGLAVSL